MAKKAKKAIEDKAAKKLAKAAIKGAAKKKSAEKLSLKKAAKMAAAIEAAEAIAEAQQAIDQKMLDAIEEVAEAEAAAPEAAEAPKAAAAPEKPALSLAPIAEGEQWKTVSIKMPVSWVETIDKAAKAYGDEGVSRSEFIRMALEEFLAK